MRSKTKRNSKINRVDFHLAVHATAYSKKADPILRPLRPFGEKTHTQDSTKQILGVQIGLNKCCSNRTLTYYRSIKLASGSGKFQDKIRQMVAVQRVHLFQRRQIE
jgi:hypothetical protein